jgi:hypothetical protein
MVPGAARGDSLVRRPVLEEGRPTPSAAADLDALPTPAMMGRPLLALALLAVTAPSMRAQQHAGSGDPLPAGRFVLGVGVDPLASQRTVLDDLSTIALHGGYERRLGSSRFAARLEGTYQRAVARIAVPHGDAFVPGFDRHSVGGASLIGTALLTRHGRARPYLLGGVGVHHYSMRVESDWIRASDGGASKLVPDPPARNTLPTLTGGAGLGVSVGRVGLFVEGRVLYAPSGGMRAVRGSSTPLTFGIRL